VRTIVSSQKHRIPPASPRREQTITTSTSARPGAARSPSALTSAGRRGGLARARSPTHASGPPRRSTPRHVVARPCHCSAVIHAYLALARTPAADAFAARAEPSRALLAQLFYAHKSRAALRRPRADRDGEVEARGGLWRCGVVVTAARHTSPCLPSLRAKWPAPRPCGPIRRAMPPGQARRRRSRSSNYTRAPPRPDVDHSADTWTARNESQLARIAAAYRPLQKRSGEGADGDPAIRVALGGRLARGRSRKRPLAGVWARASGIAASKGSSGP